MCFKSIKCFLQFDDTNSIDILVLVMYNTNTIDCRKNKKGGSYG